MSLARITPTLCMPQIQLTATSQLTLKTNASQSRSHYGGMHGFYESVKPHLLLSKASIQANVHVILYGMASSKSFGNTFLDFQNVNRAVCVCFYQLLCSTCARQNPSKQDEKQNRRPGRSKNHYHFFKRTGQSASGTKAATLVDTVIPLSNVKEEIYAALDEWVAFEVEFPVIAVSKALRRLKQREQWLRIIQVSKWMLSKGQGKTFGTYELLLKAYEMDARLEDCEVLWEKLLMHYARSVPKSMFALMMNIYKRQQMPGKLIKVFELMEDFKMRPDKDTLEMAKEAYRQLGQPEKQQSLTEKYPPAWNYLTFKGKTIKVRPRLYINNSTADSDAGELYEESL